MKKAIYVLLIIIIFFSSGCANLRKKFVRKKKYEKPTPVYVDYKEYPETPNKEAYISYYLFLRGWLEEFSIGLEKSMIKKQKRSINEAVMNLEQMMLCYNQEGKDKVQDLYQELLAMRNEVERDGSLSDIKKNQMIDKAKKILLNLEKTCKYSRAKQWMIIGDK